MGRKYRWNTGRGIWYPSQQGKRKDGVTPMKRFYPSVNLLCGSLMDIPVDTPNLPRALRQYREGLDLVGTLHDRSEFFTLAVYRRQVSQEEIPDDVPFFKLAESFDLSAAEWADLAMRMPVGTKIRAQCEDRSCHALPKAAE